ncbi:MAG: hypothetical protein KY468_14495, partial [Armatimonadetes bacterium]|nr:hypothetical protein [Armatimonadota bacterium]
QPAYQRLLSALDAEFTTAFGGCTVIRGLQGRYLSDSSGIEEDRITLIYADTPFSFQKNREAVSRYTDALRSAAEAALEEESILLVVHQIYHSG